ncbi:MAG: flagellar biosynthetic protein FliO [Verrucomicrobiota bacterium]|nr:flagellar biosynthetic protein FliO [Verrucomicrobiota bacterium]
MITSRATLAIVLLTVANTFAETVVQAPALTAPPSIGYSLIRMIGALCLVFALLFGALYLFKNWQRLNPGRRNQQKLQVLEVKSLGQRHAIYVVAYENQRLLLSSSPTGVTMLTQLPEAVPAIEPAEVALENPSLPSFAETFLQVLAKKS